MSKVIINELPPQGGTKTLFNVENEEGKLLVDVKNRMVLYTYSEKQARDFYKEMRDANTVVWQ